MVTDWWWLLALHQGLVWTCFYLSHWCRWLKCWLMRINDTNEGLSFLIKEVALCAGKLSLQVYWRCDVKTQQRLKTEKKKVSWCYSIEFSLLHPSFGEFEYVSSGFGVLPRRRHSSDKQCSILTDHLAPSEIMALTKTAPSALICQMVIPEETLLQFNTNSLPDFQPLSCVCVFDGMRSLM